jgi:hypothetical protein
MSHVALFTNKYGEVSRKVYHAEDLSETQIGQATVVDESALPALHDTEPGLGYRNAHYVAGDGSVVVGLAERWLEPEEVVAAAQSGELQPFVDSGRFSQDSLEELGVADLVTFPQVSE